MQLIFAANVLVAGAVGGLALFTPSTASRTVFQGIPTMSPVTQVVGAFWVTIALLSAIGMARPREMALVLLVQFIYKGTWLLVVALPAVVRGRSKSLPTAMAAFFLVWVVVLPFVIPWRTIFAPPAIFTP